MIDLGTGRPSMLEALARWRRPGQPAVPADVFIALAEESGAINKIGLEVLRRACEAAERWRKLPGYHDLGIAVNVSVHQVLAGRLADHVVEVLRETGLPPSRLTLEITESAALGDSDRVAAEFARLQAMGVCIAVDDFGAGYSSLGLLMSLDVDALKIDRSLLDFDTTRRGSLVMAIAELGHTLGLKVVAEGVETAQHLQRAREAELRRGAGLLPLAAAGGGGGGGLPDRVDHGADGRPGGARLTGVSCSRTISQADRAAANGAGSGPIPPGRSARLIVRRQTGRLAAWAVAIPP